MASNEDLKVLDATIQQLSEDLKAESENVRKLTFELASVASSLSKEELVLEITKMEKEYKEAGIRLEMIKSGQKKVDPNEKQKVDKDYITFGKLVKERKAKV